MTSWTDDVHLHVCRIGDTRRIHLSGELDMQSVERMPPAEVIATEGGIRELVQDLTEISFIDSTGLRWVLRVHRAADAKGIPVLTFVREDSLVLRTLNLIGAGCVFPVEIVPNASPGT